MSAGPRPARARSAAQANAAAIASGSVPSMVMPGNAVAGGLVREHPHRRLVAHRRRQRGLIVLQAEDRRQPPRRAEVDRLVPLAERRAAFADERHRDAARALAPERHRHAGDGQRADGERRRRRQDAPREIADVQILAVHRRTRLWPSAPTAPSRTVSGVGRMASATPRSRITGAITSPLPAAVPSRYRSPRRNRIAAA